MVYKADGAANEHHGKGSMVHPVVFLIGKKKVKEGKARNENKPLQYGLTPDHGWECKYKAGS